MDKSVFIPIMMVLILGCEQPTKFIRENPNDPLSSGFYPDSISNMQLTVYSEYAHLSWERGSTFGRKYQIIKADNNSNIIMEEIVDSTTTSFIDTSISPFQGYYQINQITDQDTVVQNENRISFDYFISDFKSSDSSDNVLLEWDYNGYFDTHFVIERASENGFRELVNRFNTPFRFEDAQFDSDNIGLNTYKIFPQTFLGTGDELSISIRLPQWTNRQSIPFYPDDFRAVSVGSDLYIIQAGPQNFKYDAISNTWTEIASNKEKFDRYSFNVHSISEEEVLVIGEDYYEIYNIKNDVWNRYSDVPFPYTPISYFNSVQISNDLILLTGGSAWGSHLNNSFLFNINTRTWIETEDMLTRRSLHELIKIDEGKALALGGSGAVPQKKVELFDLSLNDWTPMPDCPIFPREVVQLENGYVLVVSGEESVLFDPITQSWTQPISFDEGLTAYDDFNDLSLVALPDGNALIIGLTTDEIGGRAKSSQIFSYNKNKWIRIGNSRSSQLLRFPFLILDNKIIVIREHSYEFLYMDKFLKD